MVKREVGGAASFLLAQAVEPIHEFLVPPVDHCPNFMIII
jgi:hypothetical protein